jgi:hypothetical protein
VGPFSVAEWILTGDTATYDVFITHSWRFHDDWKRIGALLDGVDGFKWRNFSVPWYDPAMDPNTTVGDKFVHDWLESQIIPCHVFIFLESVYAINSARNWVKEEVELARTHGLPVIGLPTFGAADLGDPLKEMVDCVSQWDAASIVEKIKEVAASKQ